MTDRKQVNKLNVINVKEERAAISVGVVRNSLFVEVTFVISKDLAMQ